MILHVALAGTGMHTGLTDRYGAQTARVFWLESTYEERATPKSAGLWWHGTAKVWWTFKVEVAAKMVGIATFSDPAVEAELKALHDDREQTLAASRAATADIEIPKPEGLEYMPFQKAGIAFAMRRNRVLIADEMGLGKTIQALGLINATPEIRKILVICPASVKINWKREAEKWLVRLTRIALGDGKACDTKADMLIINFDVAHRWEKELRAITWDLLILDECHRLKSRDARRTKFILGYTPRTKKGEDESKRVDPIPAKRALLLTGTPIVNRPIEAWNIVHYLDQVNWRSFWGYAKRYAGAFESKWGWQMGGATHLDELQEKLRSTIMIRRLKAEVMPDLPPKQRQIITLPADQFAGLINNEQETMARYAKEAEAIETERDLADALNDRPAYDAAVLKLRDMRRVEFTEMARLAHETALAKVPHVVEHVTELPESVGKCVVFAHHADVIEQLMEGFAEYNPVKLTGDMSLTQRQQSIDAFQKGAARVFVGSIQAAGVGITLTAASSVVFAELDWVPGNMQQAEDRCHRIGQHDSVNVQHIVVDRSIDARRAKTLLEKQAIIDKALDDPIAKVPIVVEPERKRSDPVLTPERVKATQQALRFLALMDQDHASDQNGIGFNGGDSGFGHRLAELTALTPRQALAGIRMVKKYHRQLAGRFGPEILVTLYGAEDDLVKEYAA